MEYIEITTRWGVNKMYLYTVFEAIVGVVAGILLAVCTKIDKSVTYGKLD